MTLAPLKSGHTVHPLEGEEARRYAEQWGGYSYGMIRLQPGGWMFPTDFTRYHGGIMDYKFKSSDVVVMTWPKCGTTWLQEVVWTMRNNPDLNHPDADAPVNVRCPFLELDTIMHSDNLPKLGPENPLLQTFKKICPDGDPAKGVFLQLSQHTPDPRTIKTHLPFSLLPPDILDHAKVVYLMRNPKDVLVSYFHHCRLMKNQDYKGTFDQFVDAFVEGNLLYGHYDLHLKEALARKDSNNIFFMHFEDMKANTRQQLTALDSFLGTKLTEAQIDKVESYTSFAAMKKRDNLAGGPSDGTVENGIFNNDYAKAEGGFFRQGNAGQWKEKLSTEQSSRIDAWTETKLAGSGLEFKYSI